MQRVLKEQFVPTAHRVAICGTTAASNPIGALLLSREVRELLAEHEKALRCVFAYYATEVPLHSCVCNHRRAINNNIGTHLHTL